MLLINEKIMLVLGQFTYTIPSHVEYTNVVICGSLKTKKSTEM